MPFAQRIKNLPLQAAPSPYMGRGSKRRVKSSLRVWRGDGEARQRRAGVRLERAMHFSTPIPRPLSPQAGKGEQRPSPLAGRDHRVGFR